MNHLKTSIVLVCTLWRLGLIFIAGSNPLSAHSANPTKKWNFLVYPYMKGEMGIQTGIGENLVVPVTAFQNCSSILQVKGSHPLTAPNANNPNNTFSILMNLDQFESLTSSVSH